MSNTADKRVWVTADGKYVDDGHPDAVRLAAAPGDELPDDYKPSRSRSTDDADEKKAEPADNKKATPAQNKKG